MSGKIDDLIPSAKELQKQASIKEAKKADERFRWMAAAVAEKRTLIEKLSRPSGLSEHQIEFASSPVQPAVRNDVTEVQVYRFPNSLCNLCTDRGRANNQKEPGWQKTLTGIPLKIFSALVRLSEASLPSDQIPARRLFRRHAWRHLHRQRLG